MTAQISPNGNRCGVFLCQCGLKIAPKVDLPALEQMVREQLSPTLVETMPFPCMAPGMEEVKRAISENQLDRVLVAGCEPRVMLKKIQRELRGMGLEAEQVEMVNLRDHVALVHAGESPEQLALKGSKLIAAELAGLKAIRTVAAWPPTLRLWNWCGPASTPSSRCSAMTRKMKSACSMSAIRVSAIFMAA